MSIIFADGQALTKDVAAARSSLANPLTDADLEDKLCTLCAYGGSQVNAAALLTALWGLENSADVGSMLALARPA